MAKQFEKLTTDDYELLLRAPVLVSVLASCSFNKINKAQKADAIKLSHLKTFTAVPLLIPYYNEVNKKFKQEFENAQEKYAPFDEAKINALTKEIAGINDVISKLDPEYRKALHKSLEGYGLHVKKAAHTVFQDFVFPLALPKFSSR